MREVTSILIVDDDDVVRQSYCRSLAGTYCHVETASDAECALQCMHAHPFDLVLLDVRMPGTDGLSLLKTIKQVWPEIEVVIITGYPAVESAKSAVSLGAYDYLAKPTGPQDILHVASNAILHKRWTLRSSPSEGVGCGA